MGANWGDGAQDLLVLTPTFHPEQVGTPHYVTDLVRDLDARGLQPRVLTNMPYYPKFERFDGYGRSRRRDRLEGGRVPIWRLPTLVPKGGSPIWRALSEFNLVLQVVMGRLTGRIRSSSQVLVVSPGVPLAVFAASLLRRPGGRVVVIVHDVAHGLAGTAVGSAGGLLSRVLGVVERWCMDRADVVTVLSAAMGESLRAIGVQAPIEVVPLWPTIAPVADVSEDPGLVLYSGSLGVKQGIATLVEVADRLASLSPEARLLVRGQGSGRDVMAAEVARRPSGNLELDDFVPEDRLAESLARAAVHVVPQLPEGAAFAVPSKIYNVLAVGRPVVVTAEPGSTLDQLAQQVEAVRVVAPGDVDGFAAEIAKLLADPAERHRLGQDARAWMARTHSREAAVEAYLRLLG